MASLRTSSFSRFVALGAAVMAASCADPSVEEDTAGDVAPSVDAATAPQDAPKVSDAGLGQAYDLPNLNHPRVDFWVARFDTVPAMRLKFEGFLERGGKWAPMLLEKLDQRGMPRDLLYLAMIESGFDPRAASGAKAVGMWQFIAETGQRYGLDIDRAVDERMDPVKATDAALDYLTMLHDRFGSWYLAAASYNTGENRVARIMREQFGREKARNENEYYKIWDHLPSETRDYVPLMMAAARITKDPARWGFEPIHLDPHEWSDIEVSPATQLDALAEQYGITVAEIKELNPHFRIGRTPNDRDYSVRIPLSAADAEASRAQQQ